MQTKVFSTASRVALVALAGASLAACATVQPKYATRGGGAPGAAPTAPGGYKVGQPYQVAGIWYVPREQPNYDETGIASWYGDAFQMKATANGEVFDMNQLSAAHTTLPLPSIVEVTNLENGKTLRVRVNDRGPFVGNRIIDLSHAAAQELGYDRKGLARVRVKYVGPAPLAGPEAGVRYAEARPAPAAPVAAAAASAMPIAVAPAESIQVATLAPPAPVKATAALPPLTGAALGSPATSAAVAPSTQAAPSAPAYRIQAGSFSDQGNAQRAAAQLAATGTAVVEPIQRGGVTLYRVTLPGPVDEAEAYALRDKVAAIGFSDARVMQPF
jgi:rare lipoprotein A